jgi:TonB family protein
MICAVGPPGPTASSFEEAMNMKKSYAGGLAMLLALLNLSCAANPPKTENDSERSFEQAPILVENVKPSYPFEAKAQEITGTVWIKILVDTIGVVRETVILEEQSKNTDIFAQSVIDAAMKTKWKPALSKGKPIAVWVTYKVNFYFR